MLPGQPKDQLVGRAEGYVIGRVRFGLVRERNGEWSIDRFAEPHPDLKGSRCTVSSFELADPSAAQPNASPKLRLSHLSAPARNVEIST